MPEPVQGSIEFTTACSTTAVAMQLRISVVERRDPGEGDDRDQPEAERGGDDDRERRGEA